MVKMVSYTSNNNNNNNNNNNDESTHEANMYQTWKAIMANLALSEEKFQGIYYEVHIECNNPDVSKIEPLVFMSDQNLPQEYEGPKDWVSIFQYRFQQLGKCKHINKELQQEALTAKQILQELFKAKQDDYKVTVVQCKR